jgi:hypothetical protein
MANVPPPVSPVPAPKVDSSSDGSSASSYDTDSDSESEDSSSGSPSGTEKVDNIIPQAPSTVSFTFHWPCLIGLCREILCLIIYLVLLFPEFSNSSEKVMGLGFLHQETWAGDQ